MSSDDSEDYLDDEDFPPFFNPFGMFMDDSEDEEDPEDFSLGEESDFDSLFTLEWSYCVDSSGSEGEADEEYPRPLNLTSSRDIQGLYLLLHCGFVLSQIWIRKTSIN